MRAAARGLLFAILTVLFLLFGNWAADAASSHWVMTPTHDSIEITVRVRTPAEISALGVAHGFAPDIAGMATWTDRGGAIKCTIYVPPLASATLWVWTHEIRHCYVGNFHEGEEDHG